MDKAHAVLTLVETDLGKAIRYSGGVDRRNAIRDSSTVGHHDVLVG